MLSISKMSSSGQGDYYLNLAKANYYLEGGEPLGRWVGKGATVLGLTGKIVQEADLKNFLQGFSPNGDKLVRNAGAEKRQAGWDLTFSAPKSVSVAWSQAEPEQRKAFQHAHKRAVQKAVEFLEDEGSFSRRGKGGTVLDQAGLIVAMFEHGTSRAHDPALHTHALAMNVVTRPDGTTGSLQTIEIYKRKMTAGAIYRAELASRIEKNKSLGFRTKREKAWFEIEGVSKDLKEEFSKRRKVVEEELKRTGNSGAVASRVATLNTRGTKQSASREDLFQDWKETGEKLGFSSTELETLRGEVRRNSLKERRQESFKNAVQRLTDHYSHFSRMDLLRYVAEESQGKGLGARDILKTVKELTPELVSLGIEKGEQRYTTEEMLELEENLISIVQDSSKSEFQTVSSGALSSVFSRFPTMNDEQRNAVLHLTTKQGSIGVVSGMAGTGKSFMLKAVKEAYQQEGFEVIGASLSGKASEGLQQSSGINSKTIHRTLHDLDNDRLRLSENTVLVVDEAGMVGTRLMHELVSRASKANTKLILVGDAKQLQPVNAGGAFKAVASQVGEAKLVSIRRQKLQWARDVVHKFSSGNASDGLKDFSKRGLLKLSDSKGEAIKNLIKDWRKEGAREPEKHLMLAGENIDVRELNERAQSERYQAKELGAENAKVGEKVFFRNDRVLFTRNSTYYGVVNGQLGTVTAIGSQGSKLFVKVDSGRNVSIDLEDYSEVKLGYATTTHKAQGMTVDNTYILLGGGMQDKELSYVQVSRASERSTLYADKVEAGEELTSLVSQMSRSRQKNLARDVLESFSNSIKSERGLSVSIG